MATWCWTWKFKVELAICYQSPSLLMVAGAYHVVTSCTQVELTHNPSMTVLFINFKWNFLTGLSLTESRPRNKCVSFSAIMWDIWTTLDKQFQKQINITAEHAKITCAYDTTKGRPPHWLSTCLYLRGRLRLTTARWFSAYMWSRALATTTTSSFLCGNPEDFSASSQRPIFTKFGHETYFGVPSESRKTFSKIFTLGSFATSIWNQKSVKQALHSKQATGHAMGCTAEILFTLRCSPKASFRDWSTFLYDVRLRSYGASKLPNFRILAYFPKSTFRWPAYSLGVTSDNDYHFSMR